MAFECGFIINTPIILSIFFFFSLVMIRQFTITIKKKKDGLPRYNT